METQKYRGVAYLLGSSSTYHADGSDTGTAINRHRYRHHTIQRVKKNGEAGNPAIVLQFCLVPDESVVDTAGWTTFATLNDSTPYVTVANVVFGAIRAVRTDDVATPVQVICASGNIRNED